MNPEVHRRQLFDGLRDFVTAARRIDGVSRISVLGSILTTKADPKDIDLLLVVTDDADLTPLAKCGRRLKGHAQSINRGADVFLADERGEYIGRTCLWRDCRPGIRGSCDARHCGPRPYLHDDLDDVCLESALVERPPLTLWPEVEYRGRLPKDVEDVVKAFEETV